MTDYLNQEKIQADEAGILVVDSNRTMVSINRNFLDLWGLSKDLIVLRDDQIMLESVSKHFKCPKTFVREVQEIYSQHNLEIHDFITLKDGRIFERHSQPQWLEGEYVGRLWMFYYITDSILT